MRGRGEGGGARRMMRIRGEYKLLINYELN